MIKLHWLGDNMNTMIKAKPIAKLVAGWCLALILTACIPESVHPLSDSAQAKVDVRLVGLWSARIDNEDAFLHFIPRSDGWTEIVMVSYRRGREAGEWFVLRMFPSRIDGRVYMNLHFIAEAAERVASKRFLLARYHLARDGALTVWSMSGSASLSAIEAGLKGSVGRSPLGDNILIEANPAELVKFLRRSDIEKLFDNRIGPFRRVGM